MKQNQKSIRNGIEDLLCPTSTICITQGSNGGYSHQGSTAIDTINSPNNSTRAAYYAPATVKCVAIDRKYAFTWWQTVKPVRLANGSISHATILCGHDNEINCQIGQIVPQGVQLGNMGTGGSATGVHVHIEVSPTLQTSWIPNNKNVWILPQQIEFESAFFMDGTDILIGNANWKYLADVPVTAPVVPSKPTTGVDQNLFVNETFVFGVYKNEQLKYINNQWACLSKELDAYIGVGVITRCDAGGNTTSSQVMNNSGDYFKIEGIFHVTERLSGNKVGVRELGIPVKADTLTEV